MNRTGLICAALVCFSFGLSGCQSGGHASEKPSAPPTAAKPKPQTPQERERYAALLKRVNAILATDDQTPGREFTNRLRTDPNPDILARMANPDVEIPDDIKWRVNEIENTLKNAEKGPGWPVPPLAQIPHTATPINIDGSLDDAAWKDAISFEHSFVFNSKEEPGVHKTKWKMLWDENYLYVAYDAIDTDLQAKPRKRDDQVYADDCCELFISPDIRFRSYWEIVGNINGEIFDSIECKKATMWGCDLDMAQNLDGLKFAAKVRGTVNQPGDKDEGFTAEMAVPWSALLPQKNKPRPGDIYHFMLVRVDSNSAPGTSKATSYQPLLGWGHNIWNMAKMELMPAK